MILRPQDLKHSWPPTTLTHQHVPRNDSEYSLTRNCFKTSSDVSYLSCGFVKPLTLSIMDTIGLPILCIALVFNSRVNCFLPHDIGVTLEDSSDSKHHAKITADALEKIVEWFLQENKDLYPVEMHEKLKNSNTFKAAMNSFKSLVGKPDTFPPYDKDPSYHFTAEKLAESNMKMVLEREKLINAIKLRTFDVARVSAGVLFHTLQDFYSSTNWIELRNQMIKEELGTTSAFENVIFASPDEKTCDNCQPFGECRGNIRSNLLQEKKLTSGYYSKHRVDKPGGKCGFGGKRDTYATKDAKGGINKDTLNPDYSPHHYLHSQAANMAVESTVNMLTSIYEATIDNRESFGEFLGMELRTSLCFVIDTTGSMGDEIEDVKKLTIEMTKDAERSGKNFVLVPVNDPHPNRIDMTNDAAEMIKLLEDLKADGGGDIPEMSMSGMLLAAQNVRFGSKCYVFTDADAKDAHLKETLKGVLTSRNVKMDFKLTIVNKKRKRSTRQKRSFVDVYREIAEVSGGSITLVQKGHLKEVLKIVEIESKISSVNVAYGSLATSPTFNFYVDSTMNETFIELSVIGTTIQEVIIASPSGSTDKAVLVANVPNNKVFKINQPERGKWTASVTLAAANFNYFYRVFCESSIDFTYTLISEIGAPVEFSPIRGKDYYVSVDIFGSIDKDSLSLVFISIDGSILKETKIVHVSSNFFAKSALPTEAAGFFVGIQGVDSKGEKFRRINANIIKTSYVTLELDLAANDSLDFKPGSSIKVKAKLSNMGTSLDKWNVNIFDSSNFLVGSLNLEFTVSTNLSKTFEMTFAAPETAEPGRVSTVTLSVVAASDPKVKNVLVFHVSVVPKESDLRSPSCEVLNVTENICRGKRSLPCSSTRWNATIEVQDLDSGLKSFKMSTSYAESLFLADKFSNGTKEKVKGFYASSCCFLNATIVAVDYNGNVGRCTLKVNSASSFGPAIAQCFAFMLLYYFSTV